MTSLENITLNVVGMSCGHCVKAIEECVGVISGVSHVMVSLTDGKVRIEYSPSRATLDHIKGIIQELGYYVA